MARVTRPGSIQAVVRSVCRAVGGVECAADDLGVSISTISYGTDVSEARPGGLGVNYLDRLSRMDPGAALPLAQHFAQLAGGVFQPVATGGDTGTDIAELTAEFSDVLATHAEAHSAASDDPTRYTRAEAARQVAELDGLIAASVRLRAAMIAKAGGSA